ncbi:MAG: hypothetical protein C0626_02065 [Arcobacter sp.]|uniref:hypothetical protein n=1 Tax=uncultured Arcobacter sp. TaxID=165434 RepID=UPI000CC1C4B3|nr:hypothetical protein [uncultured Arcobacter sp.]PLY11377.1 MAG: hypothetical protein C0626_02065 [Arcobacter sp.]
MSKDEKYERFIKFIGHKNNEVLARFFRTSQSSIKRYKSGETVIPDSVILIIDLNAEIENKQKMIDSLNFELSGLNQRIYDFKTAQKRLFDV